MEQYRVKAGQCVCAHQRVILDHGEIKESSFFIEGQADKLVADGFIELFEEQPETTEQTAKKATKK